MTISPQKFSLTIEKGVTHLLSRADASRSLTANDLVPRISNTTEKYLLRHNEIASAADISEFIDSLRADDLCLVVACEKGDQNAWADLVSQYDSTVKSAAFKFAKNTEDAEDLAGSIWAELHGLKKDSDGNAKGKLGYYSGKGSLAGWLRAVTSQIAIDEFRRNKRLVQAEDDREFENLAHEAAESGSRKIVNAAKTPEEDFGEASEQDALADSLRIAVSNLEPEDRLIIKLYYFDGFKLNDIAKTFGYHEATASRKLARVQREIRASVERELSERHNWGSFEIEKFLKLSAEKSAIDLEKLFAAVIVLFLMQEWLASGVHQLRLF